MQVMIRYRLRPDQLQPDRRLLDAVYDELAATRPQDVRYATFVLEDGVSFIALAEGGGAGRFSQIESFRAYRQGLDDRCSDPPVVTELHDVRSYRFL
jgi:hypothetical protein